MMQESWWPSFEEWTAERIETTVTDVLTQNRAAIQALWEASTLPSLEDLYTLDNLSNRLSKAWSVIQHLHNVRHDDSVEPAYEACLVALSEYDAALWQDPKLYARIQAIDATGFTETQKTMLAHYLRDFRLSGAGLEPTARARLADLHAELSLLENNFSQNVLHATDNAFYLCTDKDRLRGIPEAIITQAASLAAMHNQIGWRLGVDQPTVEAVLGYAQDAGLRQEIHRLYTTRGAQAPFDNTPVIMAILEKRAEMAHLLGFSDYVAYALQSRMANNSTVLKGFYDNLIEKAKVLAIKEFEELESFAQSQGASLPLAPADMSYYSQKYCESAYGINQEALRVYFPLERVLEGLFEVLKQLFGIDMVPCPDAAVWDPSVRAFKIQRQQVDQSQTVGYFYIDPFARPKKRYGAWMDDAQGRTTDQLPIAYLVMNFRAPVDNAPAFVTHDDIVTLFHETGHGLQHLLTKITNYSVSGINGIPWDAVEIASQFLENWAWEAEVLQKISAHQDTGASLPQADIEKLRKSQRFQAALGIMRQIEYGMVDLRLHEQAQPDLQGVIAQVRQMVRVTPIADYDRSLHSFGHIFSGGYAAGYYSYLWAEVLAADAFGAFEETSIFDKETSQRFLQTFLEMGGSQDPSIIFRLFRGRDPDPAALLRKLA